VGRGMRCGLLMLRRRYRISLTRLARTLNKKETAKQAGSPPESTATQLLEASMCSKSMAGSSLPPRGDPSLA